MLVSSCCSRAVGGHVELGERRLVDDAGLAEAVARLEALDRRLDEGIDISAPRRRSDRGRRKRRGGRAAPAPADPSSRSSVRRRQAPGPSRPSRRYSDISGSRARSPRRSPARGWASTRARPPCAETPRSSAAIPPGRRPAPVAATGRERSRRRKRPRRSRRKKRGARAARQSCAHQIRTPRGTEQSPLARSGVPPVVPS